MTMGLLTTWLMLWALAPPATPAQGLCRSGPPLLVPASVAGVALDPHYAAMFAVGNRFSFDADYGPPGASGRNTVKWREDCLVARVDASPAGLTAQWLCRRSDKARPVRRTWGASAAGVSTPEFWPCDWSSTVEAVTRPPRKGQSKPVVDEIPCDWSRYRAATKSPNGRTVSAWNLTSSGGSGAGTDCSIEFGRGLGATEWQHSFGADDMFHESMGGRLVDCSGPAAAPAGN